MADGEIAVRSDSVENPQDGETPRQKPQSDGADRPTTSKKSATKGGKGASGDVGQMLRGAYRQTVEEVIPDDLMDLLNRLE